MSAVTILGLVAACFSTAGFVPQVVKTWRSRSSADLSLGMYVLLASGSGLWLTYGIALRDLPIVSAGTLDWWWYDQARAEELRAAAALR